MRKRDREGDRERMCVIERMRKKDRERRRRRNYGGFPINFLFTKAL